jgi:hypothetical protein
MKTRDSFTVDRRSLLKYMGTGVLAGAAGLVVPAKASAISIRHEIWIHGNAAISASNLPAVRTERNVRFYLDPLRLGPESFYFNIATPVVLDDIGLQLTQVMLHGQFWGHGNCDINITDGDIYLKNWNKAFFDTGPHILNDLKIPLPDRPYIGRGIGIKVDVTGAIKQTHPWGVLDPYIEFVSVGADFV